MLALVESSRQLALTDGWAGRAGSFAVHAAAISVAVALTRHAGQTRPREVQIDTSIIWSVPMPAGQARPAPATAPSLPRPVFQISEVPSLPPPNLPSMAIPSPGTDPVPGLPPGPGTAAPAPPGSAIGAPPPDARYVEEPPVLLAHPPIRYPDLLRQAGIEGAVVVEAVLDTLGRVEAGSLTIVRSDQQLFDGEALAVVALSRYRPARMSGRPVRVRMQVPVRFTIRR